MARGICISLLPNPTLADRHTVDGSGMGTFTSQITGLSSNLSTTIGYWYYPMNDTAYEANYGLLYNWPAVMHGASGSNANPSGVQGICPDGWHVPSDAECTQLLNYVNSQSQNVCGGIDNQIGRSLAATVGWDLSGLDTCTVGNPNLSANNATGFGALPAGFYSISSVPTDGDAQSVRCVKN